VKEGQNAKEKKEGRKEGRNVKEGQNVKKKRKGERKEFEGRTKCEGKKEGRKEGSISRKGRRKAGHIKEGR
jgi:hypothetical protein